MELNHVESNKSNNQFEYAYSGLKSSEKMYFFLVLLIQKLKVSNIDVNDGKI